MIGIAPNAEFQNWHLPDHYYVVLCMTNNWMTNPLACYDYG
jgi:hypothetical protein